MSKEQEPAESVIPGYNVDGSKRKPAAALAHTPLDCKVKDCPVCAAWPKPAPATAGEFPRHNDLENPPDYSTLRDDYWELYATLAAEHKGWERADKALGILHTENEKLQKQLAKTERMLDLAGAQNWGIDNLSKLDDLQQQLAAEREKRKHDNTEMLKTNAALNLRNQQLREQLDAAVVALKRMPEVAYESIIEGAGVTVENLPNELQCMTDAALAKIGEENFADKTTNQKKGR
jgi:hypothetical protein